MAEESGGEIEEVGADAAVQQNRTHHDKERQRQEDAAVDHLVTDNRQLDEILDPAHPKVADHRGDAECERDRRAEDEQDEEGGDEDKGEGHRSLRPT
jgi:hypothetical protein